MKYGALALAALLAITSCEAPGGRAAEEHVPAPARSATSASSMLRTARDATA
jgi:hypothetical protein